eukprot:3031993-Pleurochrysis_carterae.AAC.2
MNPAGASPSQVVYWMTMLYRVDTRVCVFYRSYSVPSHVPPTCSGRDASAPATRPVLRTAGPGQDAAGDRSRQRVSRRVASPRGLPDVDGARMVATRRTARTGSHGLSS